MVPPFTRDWRRRNRRCFCDTLEHKSKQVPKLMTGTYHMDSKGRDMEKRVEERACRNAWACIEDADFEQTGFSYTLSLIQGKYKMVILYCLMEFQPVRFNELRRYLKTVSDKGARSRRPSVARGVPADSAQGRVRPYRARGVAHGGTRCHVHLGQQAPGLEEGRAVSYGGLLGAMRSGRPSGAAPTRFAHAPRRFARQGPRH